MSGMTVSIMNFKGWDGYDLVKDICIEAANERRDSKKRRDSKTGKDGIEMKKFNYTIKDEVGIHARPAGLLVKEAKKYASKIILNKDGKTAEAGKLMAVMGLGVKCGQTVDVEITGEDEDTAYEAIKDFFEKNL